jgi:branched-chain amino acid transport system ATP-binding protein
MLKIQGLHVNYGGLHALSDVTIDVPAGKLVTIAGPNGAGKSTLFKAISGVVTPAAGTISFDGQDLASVRACDRPKLGIAHVPEGWQVFKSMTVLENVEMGSLVRRDKADARRDLERIFELFPALAERQNQLAGTMSGGQQQMVAIARGLAAKPRLLMLDEPSMGLAPALVDSVFERVSQIHRELKVTVLLVEQRAAEALELCDIGYVLESGKVAAHGTPAQLLNDPRVKRAYLGM